MSLPVEKTVDLTPTPEEYRRTLRYIAENTVSDENREWALGELERVKDVTEWGTQ